MSEHKIERTLIIKSVAAQLGVFAVNLAQEQDLSWAELTEAFAIATCSAAHWSCVSERLHKNKEATK